MEQKKVRLTTEEIVAKNVSAYRFMLGLDYKRFGERAGVAPERVQQIEKGIDVMANGIELLRIADACNVQYTDLFEDEETGSTGLKTNAMFPDIVYKNIYKMIENCPSRSEFARLIGVHYSTIWLWIKGKSKPGPMAFQNILTIFKLRPCDLEAMVSNEKKAESKSVESVQGQITQWVSKEPTEPTDDFESKVVKIMRLQKQLPELVDRLEKMKLEIETLKDELSKLI